MVDIAGIDWAADRWFAKHYATTLTDTEKRLWLADYGTPMDYEPSYSEQSEYWSRCAFYVRGMRLAAEECARAIEEEAAAYRARVASRLSGDPPDYLDFAASVRAMFREPPNANT